MKFLSPKISVSIVEKMLDRMSLNDAVGYSYDGRKCSDWNLKGLEDFLGANLLPEGRLTIADMEGKSAEELTSIDSRCGH